MRDEAEGRGAASRWHLDPGRVGLHDLVHAQRGGARRGGRGPNRHPAAAHRSLALTQRSRALVRTPPAAYDRRMRRLLALLLAALAAPAAALAGGTEVSFRTLSFSYDDLVLGYCAFPIRFVGSQEHWQKFQYQDLPDGVSAGDPRAA